MTLRAYVAAAAGALTLSLLGPAVAHAQAPAPATPVTAGTTYQGRIAVLHQADRYEFRSPVTGVVRIHVEHTNRRCEVWATLGDATVGSIEQNFVPADGVDIEELVVASGVYQLVVDTGPIRPCLDAAYAFSVQFIPIAPVAPALSRGGGSRCDAFCRSTECVYWCQRVASLNTLIRKLHHKIHRSRGAVRRRTLRQLHAVKRSRELAQLGQKRYCSG